MGTEVEKLKKERRDRRNMDPHAWAEEIEQRDAWRTLMTGIVVVAVMFLSWQVWTLKQDVAQLERQLAVEPCTPTPGPSGEMPPPGFC